MKFLYKYISRFTRKKNEKMVCADMVEPPREMSPSRIADLIKYNKTWIRKIQEHIQMEMIRLQEHEHRLKELEAEVEERSNAQLEKVPL